MSDLTLKNILTRKNDQHFDDITSKRYLKGAATFSVMTFSIMTLSIMDSITTLSKNNT